MRKYKNLIEVLKSRIDSNKGITIISDKDDEGFFTYKYLYEKSLNLKNTLYLQGIKANSELVIQIEEPDKYLFSMWACFMGKIIAIPISSGNGDESKIKLINILETLSNPFLLTTKQNYDRLIKYSYKNNLKKFKQFLEKKTVFYENIEKINSNIQENEEIKKSDIAFVQYSSGSTGNPKGVILTHENLIINIEAMLEGAGLEKSDSSLSWMPLTHDMGFIGFHLSPLFKGLNQFIIPTSRFIRNPTIWLKKASEHKVTVLSSPNFGYKYFLKWFNRNKDNDLDLSNVRIIFNGAEPIDVSLCRDFIKSMSNFGLKKNVIFPVYGLAEASLAVTFPDRNKKIESIKVDRNSLNLNQRIKEDNVEEKDLIEFVYVGTPVKNCKIRIVDEKNNLIGVERVGYIQIKGKNVTSGYYRNPEETKKAVTKDGWLNTGDIGFLKNGKLVVIGRLKEIIYLNGQNYYPYDLEKLAEEIDEVEIGKIVFVGVYNIKLQKNEVIGFLFYKKNLENFIPLKKKIKNFIFSKLGINIKEIVPVKKIPKTTSGKIQRYKLANMYLNGIFDDIIIQMKKIESKERNNNESSILNLNEVEEQLLKICKNILNTEKINIYDNLLELGIDSILLVQLHEKINEKYPGIINVSDFYNNSSIVSLASFIQYKKKIVYGIALPNILTIKKETFTTLKYFLKENEIEQLKYIKNYNLNDLYNILLLFTGIQIKKVFNTAKIYLTSLNNFNFKYYFIDTKDFKDYLFNFKINKKNIDVLYEYTFNMIKEINFLNNSHSFFPLVIVNNIISEKRLIDYFDLILNLNINNNNNCITLIANDSLNNINFNTEKEFDYKNLIKTFFTNLINEFLDFIETINEDIL